MRYLVYVQPNGTAGVVAPVAADGETEADTLARVAGELGLSAWEAVSPEVVAALRRADAPAPSEIVPRVELLRRLFPLTVALAVADGDAGDRLRAKWDRLLAPLQYFDTVSVTDPRVGHLVALAAGDGLLTPEQAAAVAAVG